MKCDLSLVIFDGKPRAAYPRHTQAEVYASGFSRSEGVVIVDGLFFSDDPIPALEQRVRELEASEESLTAACHSFDLQVKELESRQFCKLCDDGQDAEKVRDDAYCEILHLRQEITTLKADLALYKAALEVAATKIAAGRGELMRRGEIPQEPVYTDVIQATLLAEAKRRI